MNEAILITKNLIKINYVQAILIVAGFLIVAKIITFITQRYLAQWADKSRTKIDDIIISKIKPPFSYVMFFVGLKFALRPLALEGALLGKIIDTIVVIAMVYVIAIIADVLIIAWGEKFAKKTNSEMDDALIPLFSKGAKIAVFAIGIILILGKWNVDITPLIASLGVAGLALGFAVKDSLANIFGGISLILDRAIKVGDKIKLESGDMGIVHDIGLRSTKIRTFTNELISVPNGQLSNSRVQNFAQPAPPGRVDVDFGVEYGSDVDKVKKEILEVVLSLEDTMSDPAPEVLFLEMGDFALKFSARFWVDSQEKVWAKKLEATDKIYKSLNKAKIGIPFPTQTVYLKK